MRAPRSRDTPAAAGASTRADRADNIDAIVALCVALELAEHEVPVVEVVRWL